MNNDLTADVTAISRIDSVQKILELVCRITGMGFSAVARVTDSRWIACAVRDEISFGLVPGGELPLQSTICCEIRQASRPVIIEHVALDQEFCNHHTPQMYGFQSYASFPIHLSNGEFFGTLCAIDPKPASLKNPEILSMFKHFAELIGMQLDSLQRIDSGEEALRSEREDAQLREQFIAVLGHDLRNPLGAIKSGAQVLRMTASNEDDIEMLDIIHRSADRMAGLIDNILDFARGRLGGGLTLTPSLDSNLLPTLQQVVAELKASFPQRNLQSEFSVHQSFACDGPRIGQLLSNLLANALAHGDPSSVVLVSARADEDTFELSVTNQGKTIPADILPRLFHPFERGSTARKQEGLGLGLYIASEIARAHQGSLSVTSQNGETCFTFRMPVG